MKKMQFNRRDINILSVFILLSNVFILNLEAHNNLFNQKKSNIKKKIVSGPKWEIIHDSSNQLKKNKWHNVNEKYLELKPLKSKKNSSQVKDREINSLNRSIIFDNNIIGPDISWLVPAGLKWNKTYNFDSSVRGHSNRSSGEPLLGWNSGDAVGQIYYQPIHFKNYSIGLNIGVRSVNGVSSPGRSSKIGEGLSAGFRIDKKLSPVSGIAFGAEQLLHFDGLTDTGRDIYLTASKGFWSQKKWGKFPLHVATVGIGTGKLAEGNIKGLCSDLLGGSGTEVQHQRSLCWAPIFSIARVSNERFASFFEYNSKWFLLGASAVPFTEIPLRGTFAIQISDHIDNYKINNFDEMKWVFRLSLGF